LVLGGRNLAADVLGDLGRRAMVMNEQHKSSVNEGLEWLGIFATPLAWLTQFLINYGLVHRVCMNHQMWLLYFVSTIFLAVVIAAGILSANYFKKTSAQSGELSARRTFMATVGIFSSALYALAIIMQIIAGLLWNPCQI
jgi:hypothetical protein